MLEFSCIERISRAALFLNLSLWTWSLQESPFLFIFITVTCILCCGKVTRILDLSPEPAIRSGGQPADTLFWQKSIDSWRLSMIDHNIDEQSVFSWAPKVVRKCESKHWFSCGADRWLKATVFLAELAEFSHPRLVWNQNFNCEAHKHNIFHMNLRKTILEPAIAWKLVTCQRITLKNTDLDGSTPEPAIRSSDTSQRIPCFDSCQLITTLMSKMSALSVFLCSQTN